MNSIFLMVNTLNNYVNAIEQAQVNILPFTENEYKSSIFDSNVSSISIRNDILPFILNSKTNKWYFQK